MTKVSLYDWPSDINSLFSVITEQLYKSNIYSNKLVPPWNE